MWRFFRHAVLAVVGAFAFCRPHRALHLVVAIRLCVRLLGIGVAFKCCVSGGECFWSSRWGENCRLPPFLGGLDTCYHRGMKYTAFWLFYFLSEGAPLPQIVGIHDILVVQYLVYQVYFFGIAQNPRNLGHSCCAIPGTWYFFLVPVGHGFVHLVALPVYSKRFWARYRAILREGPQK